MNHRRVCHSRTHEEDAMTETTTDQAKFIDPNEWQIRVSLRHGGFTYGPAEPLPPLTLDEALRYEAQGSLVRVNLDGSISEPKPKRAEPKTAEEFLRGRDEIVLRQILDFRPNKRLIQEMLALAKQTGRTQSLRMMLEAICLYAGIKVPHADPH
jgi:hypothetical protein